MAAIADEIRAGTRMDLEIHPKSRWAKVEGRPLIIAGPCAAESEEQYTKRATVF